MKHREHATRDDRSLRISVFILQVIALFTDALNNTVCLVTNDGAVSE